MARIKHGTLTANTVAQVDDIAPNGSLIEIGITANPGAPIYVRLDGQDPEIKGDDCEVIPAAVGAYVVLDAPTSYHVRLKTAAGTPDFWVKVI